MVQSPLWQTFLNSMMLGVRPPSLSRFGLSALGFVSHNTQFVHMPDIYLHSRYILCNHVMLSPASTFQLIILGFC